MGSGHVCLPTTDLEQGLESGLTLSSHVWLWTKLVRLPFSIRITRLEGGHDEVRKEALSTGRAHAPSAAAHILSRDCLVSCREFHLFDDQKVT